jgi:hypothetical protein
MQYEPTTANVWAPELFYNDEQGQFIIIWASTIPFRFEKGEEEELSNHRMYYTTTKDFKTFSPTRLFLDPGFSVIDAVIVKRGKKDYVLVLKDNTRPNRNLRVSFSEGPLGPYTDISPAFTRMYTEGPTVLRTGKEWLIYFEAYREKAFGAVKTSDFKSFTDVSGEISLPAGHKHGTIFKADRKTLIGLLKESHPEEPKANVSVLNPDDFKHYADLFNRMEDENIVTLIPNSRSWEWMKENIPLFECPQDNFEEIYYYRWWTLRKHIIQTPSGYAFTEFLVPRSYADKYNLISCALGHHIYESRWLRDPIYLKDNVQVWFRGNDGGKMAYLRNFSSWTADALYNSYLINGDRQFIIDLLPDLTEEYRQWEGDHRLSSGLFWQRDVSDGMEESISGGRKVRNSRPTINSYMYGNAAALSKIAGLAGNSELSMLYAAKADTLKKLVDARLWNSSDQFFETLKEDGQLAGAREAIGFIPWYFNLPSQGFEAAWKQVVDKEGFNAPFGLTTAERRHPEFRTHGCCSCEWDGAVWPFATSQTLTAMANLLNNYEQTSVTDSAWFRFMEVYVESQYYRGRPYIGEYLDEKTGYWLKGDQERSRYYNHSTFNDLIITGIVGLRPRPDQVIEVNPLLPEGKWDWFCLDRIMYHGKNLTICWDKYGTRYNRGKGLYILVDGKEVGRDDKLERIICTLK